MYIHIHVYIYIYTFYVNYIYIYICIHGPQGTHKDAVFGLPAAAA